MRGNQAIVLDLSCGNLTKAISAEDLNSVGAEGNVKHVDVLIFGEQVQQSGQSDAATVFHQRIQWTEAFFVDGTATLNAKRNQFVANQDYKVYVIANSTYPSTAFKAIDEESDLYQLVQTDANLHLTGLASSDESTDADTTPDFFLMEGRAYTSGTSAVLNDGNAAHSTVLEADLARAVSKVVVELTAGAKVQFSDPALNVYHYRNLPYSTVTVPETGYEISPALKSTEAQPRNGYVQWQKSVAAAEGVEAVTGKITVTGYVYSYSWTALDKETSLIVNIPMLYDENDDKVFDASENSSEIHAVNYYKIPLSKDRKFERNHYYKVSAVVNAPGSESNFDPITLENLRYDTFPWVEILPPIEVGNETNKPKYLQLNKYEMEMNNIATDFETLEFSSSSAITSITLVTEAAAGLESMTNTASTSQTGYYVDKFGQPTAISSQIRDQINNGTSWGITSDDGITWDKTAINGNIKVDSPIPTNNAPRYLVYKVTNADNMVAYFTVVQYPVIYITNTQGYYSYRDDFVNDAGNVVTYELTGSGNNTYYTRCDWSNNRWTYSTGRDQNSTFCSKYVHATQNGKALIRYYYWSRNNYGNSYTKSSYNVWNGNNNNTPNDNARMYYVRITSTSSEYIVGRPKLVDSQNNPTTDVESGITASGDDNKKLVSPSFMIASQLGATQAPSTVQIAADHCKHYVETYQKDGVVYHYKDWRLPTEAEIGIIIALQNTSEAMDEVLSGASYWSASGVVQTNVGEGNNRVRCVRDEY